MQRNKQDFTVSCVPQRGQGKAEFVPWREQAAGQDSAKRAGTLSDASCLLFSAIKRAALTSAVNVYVDAARRKRL